MNSSRYVRLVTAAVVAVGSTLICVQAAIAQSVSGDAQRNAADSGDQLQEIVVSAQRREEKSLDVPMTVTTLNSAELATANVNQLSDIAKLTPGVRFDT